MSKKLVEEFWPLMQVSARREQQEMGVLDEISQIETEKKAEQDYEQLLKQEAERLRIQGYQPQVRNLLCCDNPF